MKILFIRHAKAESRDVFTGSDDLQRPLVQEGKDVTHAMFTQLEKVYPKPDAIISSFAVRAYDTATIVAECFSIKKVHQTEWLNPGADFSSFKKVLNEYAEKGNQLMLVGHEPDFSEIISQSTANGYLDIKVKKSACIEVVVNSNGIGQLRMLLPPGIL